MTDLQTLVDALKREVAVPGTYTTAFPSTNDEDLAATLADAFGEAQLQSFFGDVTLTADTSTNPTTYTTSLDLSAAGGALLVMFAGLRILRSQLRTVGQSATYKAGPVEYSTSQMTTVLRDELKALRDRIDALILFQRRSGRVVYVGDSYARRICTWRLEAYSPGCLGSFADYEWQG